MKNQLYPILPTPPLPPPPTAPIFDQPLFTRITGYTPMENRTYHFHIYYDEGEKPAAQNVVAGVCEAFSLQAGNFHDGPVGPHPTGSCQIDVGMAQFGEVMDWLAFHREGLTVFIHGNSGDVLKDHSDHTIWMGRMMVLDLDMLRRFIAAKQKK